MTRILHKTDCDNSFAISNESLLPWNCEMSSMDLLHSGLRLGHQLKQQTGLLLLVKDLVLE